MNAILLSLALVAPAHPPVFSPGPVVLVPHHQPPMTIEQFVRCFQPTPGVHHVWIIHPVTCQPVQVCFTFPANCGCPKVKHGRRYFEFDYGRKEIEVHFRRNGKVDVDY